MLIKVEFASFAIDPGKSTPLLLLREAGGTRVLPVSIGPLEASAIAIETLKVSPDRPLTIDLVRTLMKKLGGALIRAIIVEGSPLCARLEIAAGRGVTRVDCRPCDAVALALRCNAPLFAREAAFRQNTAENGPSEEEKLRAHVSGIDTLEFGTSYLE
ncbi:MAG: bifunctional nuclease family protein [Chitinispirillaceae bacterium]|jgi:hypothetical protein|nr:bifunctional nuclease family protein [Chitinispirillaceae bacterium]